MKLIVDSGSTKADWRLVGKEKGMESFKTRGIHPSFLSEELAIEIKDAFLDADIQQIQDVYFYGSGCMLNPNQQKVREFLQQIFEESTIQVESDLVAAGRAVYGEQSGLIVILGTGSSVAYFDNSKLSYRVPSLGLMLGDEGGGAWLGKTLLNHYFTYEMPEGLRRSFDHEFSPDLASVLNELNEVQSKGRYLATFVSFLFEHKKHPYVQEMLSEAFSMFFEKYVMKYPEKERQRIGFIGSVAFFFERELKKQAAKYGLEYVSTVRYPIEVLTEYHI